MKKWSTNSLLVGGIFLVVLAIGFVLFVSIRQASSVKDSFSQVDHTHIVLHQIRILEQAAISTESSARGYGITGKTEFLEQLNDAEILAEEGSKQLRKLTIDNPVQQKKIDRLQELLKARIGYSRLLVNARNDKGVAEVIAISSSGRGKELMDSLRSISAEMIRFEEELLAQRRGHNDKRVGELNIILYGILVLAFLSILFVIRQIRTRMNEQLATERKFAALLDAAPDATVIVDKMGTIRMINQQVVNLFGYERDEILGKPVEILVPQSARGEHKHHRHDFFSNAKVRTMGVGLELHAVKKDKNLFPVEISLSPIKTEEGLWVSASVRDITHRKKLENTLMKANEELEAFTYSVSHDLRAPLRGIIGFTTILEEEYASKLDDEALRITGIIRSNTHKMGNLVDDLLAFSRTGKQELVKIPVDMDKLVKEVSRDILQQSPQLKVTLSQHPLPVVKADKNTIQQVWVNLISNAVKYSAGRDEIRITIGSEPSESGIVFFVKDNGIGFDNKYRDKLFRVFQRLHSAEEFEGTGVGLALVEKIISRHGGKVWAEAEVNKGASFYFSLPE